MMARFVYILLVLNFFGHGLCLDCKKEFSICEKQMVEEIKSYKSKQPDEVYYQVCSGNGTYLNFVNCVRKLAGQCDYKSLKWCDSRQIKFTSYRFTWKPSVIHDICYRTLPVLDQDFFKHERCISKVINTPQWSCDVVYNKIRSNSITDKVLACSHWERYRSCIYDEVVRHCGEFVGKLSDFLFHTFSSYFSQYVSCKFTGERSTKCWFESMFRMEDTSTVASTVTGKSSGPVSVRASTTLVESTTLKSTQGTEISNALSHGTEPNERKVVDESDTASEVNSEKVLNDSVYKPSPNDVEYATTESNVIEDNHHQMTLARESKAISSKTLGGEQAAEDELHTPQLTHSARSTEGDTSAACSHHPTSLLNTFLAILLLSRLFSSASSMFSFV